ncbi:MAG: hypothetical protein ACLQFR_25010 [Streptosporangiaceae bacterium]
MSRAARSAAIWLDGGEVMWPLDVAGEAVNALADAGHVVLGVDARQGDDSGLETDVPLSVYEPIENIRMADDGRQSAPATIARAEAITGWVQPLILLTWR